MGNLLSWLNLWSQALLTAAGVSVSSVSDERNDTYLKLQFIASCYSDILISEWKDGPSELSLGEINIAYLFPYTLGIVRNEREDLRPMSCHVFEARN